MTLSCTPGLGRGFLISNLFASKRPTCAQQSARQGGTMGFQGVCSAPGATARSGKAFSLFKHVPAGHTAERENHKLSLLCCCRQGDVRQMFVDFPFPNADGLGDLPGGHLLLGQEEEDLLPDSLRMALLAHGQPSGERLPPHGPR